MGHTTHRDDVERGDSWVSPPRVKHFDPPLPKATKTVTYKGVGVTGVLEVVADTVEEAIEKASRQLRKSVPPCIHVDFLVK